jgi:hypothetical protein
LHHGIPHRHPREAGLHKYFQSLDNVKVKVKANVMALYVAKPGGRA